MSKSVESWASALDSAYLTQEKSFCPINCSMNPSENESSGELILPKRVWTQLLVAISYFGFTIATIRFVIIGMSNPHNTKTSVTIVGFIYLFSFLAWFFGRWLGKHGYKKFKKRIQVWAQSKYGVTFTEKELIPLVTPLYNHYKASNYHSSQIRQWYEVDGGRKEVATFSIIAVAGQPILYRQEIAGEFPSEEERERQQIIAVFAEEVGGNHQVYVYNPDSDDIEPSKTENVILLWSDPLRVELFMSKENLPNKKSVFALPVDVFFEQWVPSALAKNIQVGINWDDNDFKFDTSKIFHA